MRRHAVLLAALIVFAPPARADESDAKKVAKAQAEVTQAALLAGEFDKFVDFTHPKIVEGLGGRKKMSEKLAAEFKEMKSRGFAFKSVKPGTPSEPVKGGAELYIAVPFVLEITVPNGRLLVKSTLVGISGDGGKTWTFADANPGRAVLKKVFPDLPDALVIPKKEEPTLVKD